jgi:hypothetical protein
MFWAIMSYLELQTRANAFRNKLEAQNLLKSDLEEKLKVASIDKQDKNGAHIFLQHLAKRLNEQNEVQAARLATLALAEVFPDLHLSLEIEHSEIRGAPATILYLKDSEKGAVGDPCEAFGGGPASLLGIILRIITTVRQRGLARVLLLDEPMIQVSGQYQEKAARLLRKLCEPSERGGLGFDMLVVTHNQVFMTAAHKSYQARTSSDGKSLLLQQDASLEEEELQ